MGTFDQFFEMAREQVTFCFPNWDLSLMDLFRVVQDGRFLDDE